MPARQLPHRAPHPLVVEAAIPHRALLRDGEHPVGGGDDGGPLRGDHPVLGGASRFEELGRDEEVDVARGGKESHDPAAGAGDGSDGRTLRGRIAAGGAVRSGPGAVGPAPRTDLEIVRGGAGALRDSGHRRRLHGPPVLRGRVHEPVREHAASLSAEGRDEDRPGPLGRLVRRRPAVARFRRVVRGKAGSGAGDVPGVRYARPGRARRSGLRSGDGTSGGAVARASARVRVRIGIRVRTGHDGSGSGIRRGRARRSPCFERRGGAGPRPRGCSRPRPGRTTGRAPRRARPRRRGRIPRSRC